MKNISRITKSSTTVIMIFITQIHFHIFNPTLLFLTMLSSSSMNYHQTIVMAVKFTDRLCNFTAFPKSGCEDSETTTCVDNKCACKNGHYYVVLGRFCLEQSCSIGEYYDRNKRMCVKQSKASSDVTENHCRYDYHCYGTHVTCRQYGWNFNCVCDPGFRYDSFMQMCLPKHGIGGHCRRDFDCDETALRKMKCDYFTTKNQDGQNKAKRTDENDDSGGTCQCQENHRYNYNIDGCEALADIAQREHNMRTLILLFVSTGLMFGFVLTCNFSFFSSGSKQHELFLQRLKAQERLSRAAGKSSLPSNEKDGDTILTMVDNEKPQTAISMDKDECGRNGDKKSGLKTSLISL